MITQSSPLASILRRDAVRTAAAIAVLTVVVTHPLAWRAWRVRKIARAVDLMLTLFPFEAAFYQEHGVRVRAVGHPLADAILLRSDPAAARQALGLPAPDAAPVIALLPGSRLGEASRLGPLLLDTAIWLYARRPDLRFVLPAATPNLYEMLAGMQAELMSFELRIISRKKSPDRYVIDLRDEGKNVLLKPEEYIKIPHHEDRLHIPSEYVPIFQVFGWIIKQ